MSDTVLLASLRAIASRWDCDLVYNQGEAPTWDAYFNVHHNDSTERTVIAETEAALKALGWSCDYDSAGSKTTRFHCWIADYPVMKTATYTLRDGNAHTVTYDTNLPCRVCGEPVVEASMAGTDVCPWCDSGVYRNGTRKNESDAIRDWHKEMQG